MERDRGDTPHPRFRNSEKRLFDRAPAGSVPMPLARDEREALKLTGILAGIVLVFLVTAWTLAFTVW